MDTTLAVALFATALVSLTALPDIGTTISLDGVGIALIAVQTLTLAWRRKYPVAVMIVVTGAYAIDRALDYPPSWAFFGIAIAIYTVGAELSARRSWVVPATRQRTESGSAP